MAAPQAHNPAHTNPIPPAIRRQAEQAEKLQRQSTGQPEPVEGQPPVDTGPPPVTDASYQAQPPVVTQPPQPPAADEQLRMVQGRLDAEREQTQNMRGQIASLERMVRDLQEQRRREPPPAAEAPAGNQRGKLVTPEEEEDYGEELLSVMGKRARDAVADEMDGLRDEVRKLQGMLGQVGQRVQARDTNDLFSVLQGKVPGWVEQNSDPEFISWLQQPEPFSGIKRHDLLTRAFELQDAPRVVKFFEGYLNEAAATGQRPQTTPTPSSGNPTNGKVPLETFAAPGRAAQAPASAPPGQKPTYTRSGISQFFTDKAAGKWRGREAEAANIEADIFRAGPEGRVMG
jgi:hypothetical protein